MHKTRDDAQSNITRDNSLKAMHKSDVIEELVILVGKNTEHIKHIW